MALNKKQKFDKERIKKLTEDERFITNSKINDSEIEKIYEDYAGSYFNKSLENIKNEILDLLNKNMPSSIHSIRGRVKAPDHLIEKIYRKSFTDQAKYGKISEENYNKLITDLIGIRIIIMDKRDWRDVHDSLLKLFHNDPEKYIKNTNELITNYDKYGDIDENGSEMEIRYHVEKPVVYAMSEDDRSLYLDENLDINESRENYRSIHYIVRYKDVYFEIQVRTLFEEGWLEFDHRIKYPYDNSNVKKKEYASILNSLAQTADKLISFYDEKDFKQNISKRNNSKQESAGKVDVDEAEASNIDDKLIMLY